MACVLRLRTLVLSTTVFLVLACGSEAIPATSPPQVPVTPATATLESTATPQPTHSPTTQPPATGARLFEGNTQHLLNPSAATEAGLAIDQMLEGDYEAALVHLRKAKKLEGSPSSVLEAYTGIVYGRMGQNDLAVDHHSRAIAIEDSISNRMNRAGAYRRNGQCDKTIEDAQAVLGFQHVERDDVQAAVQARLLLMECYITQGQDDLALEHVIDAVKLAERHGYEEAVPGDWNETVATLLAWSREGPSRTP